MRRVKTVGEGYACNSTPLATFDFTEDRVRFRRNSVVTLSELSETTNIPSEMNLS
jgi:hypothetical protein